MFFFQDYGPPENVVPVGTMSHTCQDDLVLKVTQSDVPYFNAPIYLENKQQVRNQELQNILFIKLRNYESQIELRGLQKMGKEKIIQVICGQRA